MVMYENAREKWITMHKWVRLNIHAFAQSWPCCLTKFCCLFALQQLEHPAESIPMRMKDNKHEAIHQVKYTIQDGGQKPFQGWKTAGLTHFNDIKATIKSARETNYAQMLAFEKVMLTALCVGRNSCRDRFRS